MNQTLGNRHGSEWLVREIDLRVGGQWRFVVRADGMEVGFHGEFREIPTTRLDTTMLEESGGVTTMTVLVQVTSQDLRDAILASGMERGMQVSYNRLEDLVRQDAA